MAEVVDALITFPRVYGLSQRELYEKVIADIRDGNTDAVNRDLFQSYSENLRRGISGVLGQDHDGDKYLDMRLQFDANAARFAAYKAYHATQQLERQLSDSDGVARSPEDFERMAKAVLNTFNRYQAAEYNTAVSRARTAKQWTDFSDPDHAFLFPNLRWLPSRSATPREQHMPFYNRVWAKTDPFWNSNQPGNLWNCKCDWEETDDPVTGDNPEGIKPAKGLEGNPAETGQIFTDQCTYVQKAGKGGRAEVEDFFRPFAEHHRQFTELLKDPDYGDVDFDWNNAGLKATHVDHNFNKTGGEYEKQAQTAGFKAGHAVILESEKGFESKCNEGLWDGREFEVAGRETATSNNVLRGLVHCAKTPDTRIAVLVFPNGGFNDATIRTAIARYIGYQKVDGFDFVRFDEIICIQGGDIVFRTSM